MSQNPLVKGVAAVVVIVPLYMVTTSEDDTPPPSGPRSASPSVAYPMVTESEDIAALSGHLSNVEAEQARLKASLNNLVTKDDLAVLKATDITLPESPIDQEAILQQVDELVTRKTQDLERALTAIKNQETRYDQHRAAGNDEFTINLDDELAVATDYTDGDTDDHIVWQYPVDHDPALAEQNTFSSAAVFDDEMNFSDDTSSSLATQHQSALSSAAIPFATIHGDSSMHGATAITGLVGRIERKGQVHDPFRFQIVLSRHVLMANGHTLDGVKNAIASGVGVGDKAFECVRGKILSLTFNFEDGRIFNQKGSYDQPVAVIGDEWGNPCVKGKVVSNASEYLLGQGLIGGAAAYAEMAANMQQSTNNNTGNTQLAGSSGAFAAGGMAKGALDQVVEQLKERFSSIYEAVYVPPGEKVSLLFVQDVAIDYVPTNRKVRYEESYHAVSALY